MPNDPLLNLLDHLRAREQHGVLTSPLGRLRRTAAAGARAGLGALAARLKGADANLGSLEPEALARLVETFGELKGVAMKAGQILSYVDGSLDPQARRLLAVLQTSSQPTHFRNVEATIREDLGARSDALLARLEREPVATASIGQVHRAVREDGTSVAVKVRHPGIDDAIRADFKSAAIGKVMARLFVPGVNVADFIAEAKERFLEECDYALEARRQARFVELFARHPAISIPTVHADWSGPRVLTTTWHDGLGLEPFLAQASAGARELAARSLYEFYVGALYRYGLFNADPHPGNLLFAPDGRVTLLDHGCVREFEPGVVEALIRLSRAVRRDDPRCIQRALADIGMPDPADDYDATRALLRGFYAPLLQPGRHAIPVDRALPMGEAVKLKKAVMKMRLPGKLMFLFRIRLGLYAVLARIGAELDWAALEDEVADLRRL
ncbi:MAG: ABC1 kinase family protein [Myxococcales bacterium]|jgi:predicted unusual protein kinase regulating ubiquinone biosynthesis (AarF/ABC1/UbiB family)